MSDFDATIQAQLQREADRMNDPQPLSPRSKRRIHSRQVVIGGATALSVLAVVVGALTFLRAEKPSPPLDQSEQKLDRAGVAETIVPIGTGRMLGEDFKLNQHTYGPDHEICYALVVRGTSDCIYLSTTVGEISAGIIRIEKIGAVVLVRAPETERVGFRGRRVYPTIREFSVGDSRYVIAAVGEGVKGWVTKLAADGRAEEGIMRFESSNLFSLLMGEIDIRTRNGRNVVFEMGQANDFAVSICPRLLPPGEPDAAKLSAELALSEWALANMPEGASGWDRLRVRKLESATQQCSARIGRRSYMGNFHWVTESGDLYRNSASISFVNVLLGRTVNGWEVWLRYH